MKRDMIDFHQVPERHTAVHARLEDWARWVRNGGAPEVHPMFSGVRPSQTWEAVEISVPVNIPQARQMEAWIGDLAPNNGLAVRWCYAYRTSPMRQARIMGATLPELWEWLQAGRDLLNCRLQGRTSSDIELRQPQRAYALERPVQLEAAPTAQG